MAKHIHANEIHAFAEGAEIQVRAAGSEEWWDDLYPCFFPNNEYRIKPRTVKREGWVAVYKLYGGASYLQARIYDSKDAAVLDCPNAVSVIKIEWGEEK